MILCNLFRERNIGVKEITFTEQTRIRNQTNVPMILKILESRIRAVRTKDSLPAKQTAKEIGAAAFFGIKECIHCC